MKKKLIILIFVIGAFLRLFRLSDYPAGFSADEVNQGYTAYSILETGRDEWGEFIPITPRSYGDYRAPLYTYLTIPSVALFGLNEFAVRLPNAILGSLTVLVVYLLVNEMIDGQWLMANKNYKKDINNSIINHQSLPIFASFLIAISPWHVMLSRGAFEPNLPSFFIPLSVLFFLKGTNSKKYMSLAMLVFGIGLFTYYSARFLIPVILFALFYLFFKNSDAKKVLSKNKLPLLIFSLFFFVAAYTMFIGAGIRSSDVSILNPTDAWSGLSEHRYEAVILGLPDFISRVFSNKLTFTLNSFSSSYLSYFSPQFLFTSGAGEATYGLLPGQGLLYLIELPFLLAALYLVVKNKLFKTKFLKLVFLMILIAPMPAALAKGPGFAANRAAVMVPWIQMLSALGGLYLYRTLKKHYKQSIVKLVFVGTLLLSTVSFLEKYYFHAPIENSKYMSFGFSQAFEYVRQNEDKYNQIIINRGFSEPQMFTAFYMRMDPDMVQKESQDWLRYEEEGLKFVDMLAEYKLDKFVYKTVDYPEVLENSEVLIIDQPENVPENVVPSATVTYPNLKPAIYLIETSQKAYANKNI